MNISKHEVKAFTNYWKDYADYFSLQEINYDMNLPNTAIDLMKNLKKMDLDVTNLLRMFMRYNGGFYPCFPKSQGFDDFSLGNIKNNTIKQAWDHSLKTILGIFIKKGVTKIMKFVINVSEEQRYFMTKEVFPSQT